ncbi:hypothetical protein ACS2QC_23965 [Bacillus cereus group sp. Bce033]|uniref:hypothetical protein n=1 Tax=Bacillus TaxID=1386 RepID=UPI000F4FC5EE|nr:MULTISPECIES: hypothetical protein [Bacillus]AYY28111.1 hypothetical protein EGX95_16765 [Bacillus sp. FDAARGOS_527]MCU5470828.1 hypothetical protein [Bacillus paranthracis]MDA1597484.1 hypothetical protein [Bacillus cereus group sp. TH217LC]
MKKGKVISIFMMLSIFLLLMGCENKKEETLADKAFEENSKTEDRAKEQEDAQMEEKKDEGRQAVLKTMPLYVIRLTSSLDNVANDLSNKATTDKKLKDNLKGIEKYAKDIQGTIEIDLLPKEYKSVENNLQNLSTNSITFINEAVKYHQGKDNEEKVKALLSEMLSDIDSIRKVLPLDNTDNGFYSVASMKDFIQKQ